MDRRVVGIEGVATSGSRRDFCAGELVPFGDGAVGDLRNVRYAVDGRGRGDHRKMAHSGVVN